MLNKKLCKKCWKKTGKEMYGWEEESAWTGCDEFDWKEGWIECPNYYIEKEESLRKITEQPPIKCPYYLEHVI